MATPRRRQISAAAAALAVGVGGWVVAVNDPSSSAVDEGPAQNAPVDAFAMPFVITFSHSPSGDTVPFGQNLLVNAEAISSEPIERFELWDGGLVVDEAAPATPDSTRTYLEWNALVPGRHLLFVRAVDALGAVAMSAARTVTVGVTAGAAQGEPAFVETEAGTSAGDVAAGLGVPPSQVIVGEDADGPVTAADDPAAPVGPWVSVVLAPPFAAGVINFLPAAQPAPKITTPDTTDVPTTEPPNTSPPDTSPPVDTTSTTTTTTNPAPAAPTSDHSITVTVTDCKATLTITPPFAEQARLGVATNGSGFFQNRYGGIQAGADTYVDGPLMPGTYVWVTEIDSGVAPLPVSATVPPECAQQSGWSGNASIINGELSLPYAMSGVYLYIGPAGASKSNFQRIPSDPSEFINASLPKVDVSPLIPYLSTYDSVVMEVWVGDAGSAIKVAEGLWQRPEGVEFQEIVGAPQSLDLFIQLYSGTARSRQLTLQDIKNNLAVLRLAWTGPASKIYWQVTNHPLDRYNTSLLPTGLLASGASSDPQFFDLDAAAIPHQQLFEGDDSAGGGGGVPAGTPVQSPAASLDPNSPPDFGAPSNLDITTAPPAEIEQHLEALTAPAGREAYVRALAIENNQVIGIASPLVRIIYPYEEPASPLTINAIDFDPGNIPNSAWSRCALVEVPWDEPGWVAPADISPEQLTQLQNVYYEDGSYCYVQPTSEELSAWEELGLLLSSEWDMIKDGWDAVATLYNNFLDDASSFLAAWNPVCEWLGEVSASADATCKQATKAIAKIAISAVMTYLGLPPSIPTGSQVADAFVGALEGDLSAIAEGWMAQLGVPCDDLTMSTENYDKLRGLAGKAGVDAPANSGESASLCKELARIIMRKAVKEAEQLISQQSAAVIGGPAPPTPIAGFSMVPDPDGIWQPMTAVVTATRNPEYEGDLPDSFTCQIAADLSSENNYSYPTFYAGTVATMRLDTSGAYPAGTWVASFVFTQRTSMELAPELALEIDSFGAAMTLQPGLCNNAAITQAADFGPPAPNPV